MQFQLTEEQLMIQKACGAEQTNCPEPELVARTEISRGDYSQDGVPLLRYKEQLGEVAHDILINPSRPDMLGYFKRDGNLPAGEFLVPEGHYFAMGDNRDNSIDSRFWGFVPADNLVGKAVFIWMSFEFTEDPNSWVPGWVPVGVRFERLGPIR